MALSNFATPPLPFSERFSRGLTPLSGGGIVEEGFGPRSHVLDEEEFVPKANGYRLTRKAHPGKPSVPLSGSWLLKPKRWARLDPSESDPGR